MRKMRFMDLTLLCTGFCLLLLNPAWAQQTGALSGTVKDPSDAVIQGATLTATNNDTGTVRTVETSSTGQYVLSPLPVGRYTLEVKKDGFKRLIRSGITIDINTAIALDLTLTLGSQSENVTVTDTPPTINTESQEVGNLRLPEQIQNLPINVREVQTLVGQTAGVPYGTGGRTSADTDTVAGTFSQGGRAGQQVLADGAQLNPYQTTGYPAIDGIGRRADLTVPNVDIIHEFRMVTSGGSAEYVNPVAIVVATKSGSNNYHGDIFEAYQSGGLAAKFDLLGVAPSQVPSPSFVRHQFGGFISGPILKNKLVFAAAFEEFSHVRIVNAAARYPTDAERAGNLSSLLSLKTPIQLYEPGTRNPIPNNRLDLDPRTPVSAVSKQLLTYIPSGLSSPSSGSAYNTIYSKPQHDKSQKYDGRLDYNVSSKDITFGRATIAHIDQAFQYPGAPPGSYGIEQKNYYTHLITGTYTRLFTQDFLAKVTVSHRNEPFKNTPTYGNTVFPVPIAGLTTAAPFAGPPAVTMNTNALGISDMSNRQFLNWADDNDWQVNPSINWTRGKHNIIAGLFYIHGNKTAELASAPWGQYAVSSDANNHTSTTSVTGDAFADYLLGYPTSTDVTSGPKGGFMRKQNISFYIQDNWRPTGRLTLNLGMRYDNLGFFQPQDSRFANADFTSGKIVIPDGSLAKIQRAFQPFLATFVEAHTLGLNSSLTHSNNLAFVPRLGFAYRFDDNTALRGGFGMYNNDVNNSYYGGGINGPPFTFRSQLTRALTAANGITDSQFTFDNPTASGSTASAATTLAAFTGWNTHYPMNQAYEYSLTLERQLGAYAVNASYVGNYQNGLPRYVNVNACVPGSISCTSRTATQNPRQYTQFGINFGQQAADGTSNYSAVYVELQRRMKSGYSFDLNFAHARLFTYQQYATNPVSQPHWHYDYGPVQAQPYNIFHFNHVLELPFGRGKRFGSNMNRVVDNIVGNWKLSGVGTWQSGQPLTITGGSTSSPTSATTNRADRICDGRGQQPGNGVPHSGTWFNTSCYAVPAFVDSTVKNPTRQFGTASIGTVIGPGVVTYDGNVQKSFPFTGERMLVVRIDAFNLFNHPLLAPPNLDVTGNAATFGHTTSMVSTYQQRQLQFGARFVF